MHHGIKKLLLLGAGHAHVHVLSRLAQNRPADLDVTVITPYPYQTYSGMTPGFVAGRYSEQDCQIPLEPLIKAAGAKWVRARCTGIDAAERRVRLSPAGKSRSQDEILPPDLPYQFLSIDTGAVIDEKSFADGRPGVDIARGASSCDDVLASLSAGSRLTFIIAAALYGARTGDMDWGRLEEWTEVWIADQAWWP